MPVNSLAAAVHYDLAQNPLGQRDGDPQFGANLRAPAARIFLKNHSAEIVRRFKRVPVSERRGAAQALAADKNLRDLYNMATFYEAVKSGEDMNVYGQKKQAVWYAPKFDGREWRIPPATKEGEEPPQVQVPEGLWDLLMGNYDRMNSPIAKVRAEEAVRFAVSMTRRTNFVRWVTLDGERKELDNPFGFIEVIRQSEKFAPIQIDADFLTAVELVES